MKKAIFMLVFAILGLAASYFVLMDTMEQHALKMYINGDGMMALGRPSLVDVLKSSTFLKAAFGILGGAVVGALLGKFVK